MAIPLGTPNSNEQGSQTSIPIPISTPTDPIVLTESNVNADGNPIPVPASLPSDPVVLTEPSSSSGGSPINIPDSIPSDPVVLTDPAGESGGSPVTIPTVLPRDPIVLTEDTIIESGSPITIPSVLPADPLVLIETITMPETGSGGVTVGPPTLVPFVNATGENFVYDADFSYFASSDTLRLINIIVSGTATISSLSMGGVTVNTIETTITDDDTHIPTSGAIVDYVTTGAYVHPNHSGQVTSLGDGAQTLAVSAITDWTTPASFTGGENFLVEFAGTLYEMPQALINTYLEATLGFAPTVHTHVLADITDYVAYVHPNHSGEVTSVGDGAQTLQATAITNRSYTAALVGSEDYLINDTGTLKKVALAQMVTYFNSALTFPITYVHPNHSGQVTSVGDGAQSLTINAITDQTNKLIGDIGISSEFLIGTSGTLGRLDLSVLRDWMQSNLTFTTPYVHPNHSGQVTSTADGPTFLQVSAITAQSEMVAGVVDTDEMIISDGGVLKRLDVSVLGTYMTSLVSFPVTSVFSRTGAVVAQAGDYTPAQVINLGLAGEIPYMNSGPSDFTYNSSFVFSAGTLQVNAIISSDIQTDTFLADTSAEIHQLFLATGAKVVHIEDTALTGAADALVTDDVITAALAAQFYTHPNHTGQVTSVGDGAQTLTTTAITAWTTPASFTGGENFLVEFGGVLYEMPWALMETYLDTVYAPISVVGDYVDLTTVQTVAGEKTWSNDGIFSSDILGSATSVIKIGPWANLNAFFEMALGFEVNTDLISGMDFKNSNTAGQVRFMARNDQDAYLVMNAFGSTAVGTLFGENRVDIHAIFGVGNSDPDKKLAIGTFTAGDLILGTNDTARITVSAAGATTLHTITLDNTEDYVVTIDNATGLLTKRAVSTIQPAYGTDGQVPYMNVGGTAFQYTASVGYYLGIFTVPNLAISALAADGGILYSEVATGKVKQSSGLTFDGSDLTVTGHAHLEAVHFDTAYVPTHTEPEGAVWWNADDYALNVATGLGTELQVGLEQLILVYNNTGADLADGKVVQIGGGSTGNVPHAEYAQSNVFENCDRTIAVMTSTVTAGNIGFATTFGKVRGLNTTGIGFGQLYLSDTVAGDVTNVKPEFPSYSIEIGAKSISDAVNGELTIQISGKPLDTTLNFWNGTIRESFSFTVTSAAGVITGSLADQEGDGYLTYLFEDGLYLSDVSTPLTITMTPGTDTVPVTNYVYILESTKALTISTVSWPSVEHIRVASVVLQSAATTAVQGVFRNQNWNDHVQGTDGQGHLSHIGAKLRNFEAQWDSGIEAIATLDTVPTPDSITISTTSGVVFQMHPQTFPAFDTAVSDDIHVVNDFTTPYTTITDLNEILNDALGNTLNNKSFSFVLWGVVNSGSEPNHLMLNLPTGSYAFIAPDNAVEDASNYSVYTIPKQFAGVGFLIARFTCTYKNNAWTIYDTEDLRGRIPNLTAGGGSGGSGVTSFTGLSDTPASYIGEALKVATVNAGETGLEFTTLSPGISFGLVGEVPYTNATVDDYDYASGFTYASSVLTVPGLKITGLAAADQILYTNASGNLTSTSIFTFNAGLLSTLSLKLNTGATVDTIETTVTNDDTHLPTSGAVFDAVAAVVYTHPNHSGQVDSVGDGAQSLNATAITAQTGTAGLVGGENFLIEDTAVLKKLALAQFETYLNANLSFNDYTHPNHTGHVTSTGDGATVLTVAAITGQTELTSAIASTDELLINDGGVIKRVDITFLEAYMQSNLSFNNYVHPNHSGQVTSVADGAQTLTTSAITDWTTPASFTGGENFLVEFSATLYEMPFTLIETYLNANLSFNDYTHPNHTGQVTSTGDGATVAHVSIITSQTPGGAIAGTDTMLRQASGILTESTFAQVATYVESTLTLQSLALGTLGQVPYMNSFDDNFDYSASMTYASGIFTVPNLAISALATSGAILYTQIATGNVQQSSNFTYDGTTLAVPELDLGLTGLLIDTIEGTLTNDATHLPTSSAVFAAISAATYTHPNHSGQVTSVGDGAQTLALTAITDWTSLTIGLMSPGDEVLITNSGLLKRLNLQNLNDWLETTLNFNDYSHPNHTGEVTSVADGAQTVGVTAISNRSYVPSADGSEDFLVKQGSGLWKLSMTQFETYLNANLSFYTHPNHTGQVTSTGDGATAANSTLISAQGGIPTVIGSENLIMQDGATLYKVAMAQLNTYLNANLSFGSSDVTINGSTSNGVATYGGADTIDIESQLTFNAGSLVVGSTGSTSYVYLSTSATYDWFMKADTTLFMTFGYYSDTYLTLTSGGLTHVGSMTASTNLYVGDASTLPLGDHGINVLASTAGDFSTLFLGGNRTTDSAVGDIVFTNVQTSEAYGRIALIRGERNTHNNSGMIRMWTTTSSAALEERFRIDSVGNVSFLYGNSSAGFLRVYSTANKIATQQGYFASTGSYYFSGTTKYSVEGFMARPYSYQSSDYTLLYQYSNGYGGIFHRQGNSMSDLRIDYNYMEWGTGSTTTAYRGIIRASTTYIQVKGATEAILYLDAISSSYDTKILFREVSTTKAIAGYDTGINAFQIHTGTAFTTLASADFSISDAGYIYMGNLRSVSNTNYLRHNTATGEVTYYSSDRALKKNIRDFEDDALVTLKKFKPRTFEWKDDGHTSNGWIAQEGVDHILNMFPMVEKTGLYTISEGEILPFFHKAILQLDTIQESQEEKIKKLQDEVKKLKRRLAKY